MSTPAVCRSGPGNRAGFAASRETHAHAEAGDTEIEFEAVHALVTGLNLTMACRDQGRHDGARTRRWIPVGVK